MKKKASAWAKVIVLILVTLLSVYGIKVAKKGGILDDSLLNWSDSYHKMDQFVKGLSKEGLKTGDVVNFVIPFPKGISKEELVFVKSFTDKLKEEFPEYGIISLSTAADYRANGQELLSSPFISDESLEKIEVEGQSGIEAWKERVKNNPAVYGLLIGRNLNYAQVVMMLPDGYDEIKTFRRVTKFYEQKKTSEIGWYFKKDIHPAKEFEKVFVTGWVMARGLMDAALIAEVFKLSLFGFLLVGIAFRLSFLSWKQAIIATTSVALSFFWVTGTIGLLQMTNIHLFGVPIYMRIYILLVYTSLIVAGISFAAKKFDAYNEVKDWKKTNSVNEIILITASIAILNFGTLYQIQVRGVFEMGVLSALGIVYLVILVLWFMPAMHVLIGGEAMEKKEIGKLSSVWNNALNKITLKCYKLIAFESDWKKPAKRMLTVAVSVVALAIILVTSDYIPGMDKGFKFVEVMAKPLEYIYDTRIYLASQFLNEKGNYGFDRLPISVRPKNGGSVEDPEFIARVDVFKLKILEVKESREVHSITDSIKVVSRALYHKDLPETQQEVHDALGQIEFDLGPVIKEQLWHNGGVVVFASLSAEDSNKMAEFRDSVIAVAQKDFPELEVIPFGKVSIYPEADKYIREGKPINVFTSQWMVIVIYAGWIIWKNRKMKVGLYGWRAGLVMNVPFLFATGWIVVIMVGLRIPLDQTTASITALAINAASDFGLNLVAGYQSAIQKEKSLPEALHYALVEKGRVVVVDIILNCICFLPLVTSNFQPIARLGWIMIVMLLTCGFGALVIMPAFLPWCVKKQI